MTRVIGGRAGGRRLDTPRGEATRPTSDRVREALFSAVEARWGPLEGARFLDLYAGSGAVGLEAWSRGADTVTFVESDRRTAGVVRGNARRLGLARADVVARSVASVLGAPPPAPYDVVFLDPPYPLGEEDLADVLARLATGAWLAPSALVVVERSARSPEPAWPPGLAFEQERRYGETRLWYAQWDPARWYGRDAARSPGSPGSPESPAEE